MNKIVGWFALWVCMSGSMLLAQTTPTVRFTYDDAGQLILSVDTNNNATVYRYDGFGNLVSIDRMSARGPVDIFLFDPSYARSTRAPDPGQVVIIYGIGFSGVPAQNQVAFNGVAAVVEGSTATTIKTRLPVGATTGPVRVTSPLGTAVSRKDFIVSNLGITVSPADVTVGLDQSQEFTAIITEADTVAGGDVRWSISAGSGAGTIDQTGRYTAPSILPDPPVVTVTATSVEDPTVSGSTRLSLVPTIGPIYASGGSYYRLEPPPPPAALTPIYASGGSYYRLPPPPPPASLTPIYSPGGSYITLYVTRLSPNQVARGATNILFTITGRHLNNARALDFLLPSGVRDTNITATNVTTNPEGTQVTARISVASAAAVGARTVVVQTPVGPTVTRATTSNQLVIE